MAGMRVFRKLDVEDKKSQAELFDMFLKAAFLYDDKLRIVFQIPNEHDSVEVPIERMAENKGLEEIRDTLPEKFGQKKICSTSNLLSEPKQERQVRMYQGFGVFIFDFPLYTL